MCKQYVGFWIFLDIDPSIRRETSAEARARFVIEDVLLTNLVMQ